MRAVSTIVLICDWLIALAWLLRTVHWLRGISRVPDLSIDSFAVPPQGSLNRGARLSVVVPARNEEKAIAACLGSLLASTSVELEILAADDRSTDATGRVMDAITDSAAPTASSSNGHSLRVLHLANLPEGWMGKTHAMARAAAEATGEWLLFTDGDVVFAPEALARVLAYAQSEQADHVVLYPTMVFQGFGERMMISFLHAMSIWGPRPWRVGEPGSRNDFIGIGAFNLVRRSVYDAVGGWGALRMEVLEDLRMGFTIKRASYRQRAVFGRDLIRIRWAEGAYGVVTNMTKNLFALFRFRLALAALALGSLLVFFLLPYAALVLGGKALAPLLLTLGLQTCLYARYHRLGLPGVLYSLTFPAGSVLFLFAFARSIAATLLQRGVNWRGTFYPLAQLRKHAGPLR